jgi:hypothetical protein
MAPAQMQAKLVMWLRARPNGCLIDISLIVPPNYSLASKRIWLALVITAGLTAAAATDEAELPLIL